MPESLINMWWGLPLLGVVAGVLSGALGLGSGTILIPAMVLLFGLAQKSAQGTTLAVMVPMALLGAFRYWKNPDIDVNLLVVALVVGGALVGSLIGTELAARIPISALKKIFAIYLLIVAVKLLTASPKPPPQAIEGPTDQTLTAYIQEGNSCDDPR